MPTQQKKTRRLTTNTKFMNHLGLHPSPKTVALNLHHDNNKKVISIKGVLQREKLQKKNFADSIETDSQHVGRTKFPTPLFGGRIFPGTPSRANFWHPVETTMTKTFLSKKLFQDDDDDVAVDCG